MLLEVVFFYVGPEEFIIAVLYHELETLRTFLLSASNPPPLAHLPPASTSSLPVTTGQTVAPWKNSNIHTRAPKF